MIDYEKSAKLNGVGVEELKAWFEKYPGSGRRIIRVCDNCGEERKIRFQDYTNLCKMCAHNTPEYLKAKSEERIKYCADPEVRKEMSKIGIERFKDQTKRDKQSEMMIQYYKNNPEIGKFHSEFMIERCSDPEIIKTMREIGIKCWEDQTKRDKQSEIMKNSKSHQKQCGGYDIVNHHVIYDHSDLTKHTMPITRSMHGKIHALFRKYKIEIPHINFQ